MGKKKLSKKEYLEKQRVKREIKEKEPTSFETDYIFHEEEQKKYEILKKAFNIRPRTNTWKVKKAREK